MWPEENAKLNTRYGDAVVSYVGWFDHNPAGHLLGNQRLSYCTAHLFIFFSFFGTPYFFQLIS